MCSTASENWDTPVLLFQTENVLNVCNILRRLQTKLVADDKEGGHDNTGSGGGDNVYEQIRINKKVFNFWQCFIKMSLTYS